MTAGFAAVKAGIMYRAGAANAAVAVWSALQALAAPLLLFVPAAYVLRSFFRFFFFAQVVSETFALAIVLWAVTWMRTGERRYLWLAALCGVGLFLTWPVWMGPATAAVLTAIAFSAGPRRRKVVAAAVALGPLAAIALLYTVTHTVGTSVIGSSGAVTGPSAATLVPAFVALGLIGAGLAIRTTAALPVLVLMIVAALQALAIAILDRRAGTSSLYMPFKMVYLAVLPCAVLGALALAQAAGAVASRVTWMRRPAAVAPLAVAVWLSVAHVSLKREHGPITEPALAAGRWAQSALPPGCVDYFSRHWLTGYWWHFDVLGNPRLSVRMSTETFEFRDVVGKWIEGRGLPYALVEDSASVPRDARVEMIPLRQFGPAAVVRNRRPVAAPESDSDSAICRGK